MTEMWIAMWFGFSVYYYVGDWLSKWTLRCDLSEAAVPCRVYHSPKAPATTIGDLATKLEKEMGLKLCNKARMFLTVVSILNLHLCHSTFEHHPTVLSKRSVNHHTVC